MAELDLRCFDDPEDEGQLRQLVNSVDVLDVNILGSNDVRQLLDIFERFPDDDGFESFWGIVHLLERSGGYDLHCLTPCGAAPVNLT